MGLNCSQVLEVFCVCIPGGWGERWCCWVDRIWVLSAALHTGFSWLKRWGCKGPAAWCPRDHLCSCPIPYCEHFSLGWVLPGAPLWLFLGLWVTFLLHVLHCRRKGRLLMWLVSRYASLPTQEKWTVLALPREGSKLSWASQSVVPSWCHVNRKSLWGWVWAIQGSPQSNPVFSRLLWKNIQCPLTSHSLYMGRWVGHAGANRQSFFHFRDIGA